MFNNTDNELRRYEEAELYSATATPDMFSDIKSQFNTVTGETDLLAPLPSGGFVRLASQAPDIMVEAPTMPGMGADAALPVEGPIARAAEQTALETEPATAEMRPSLAGRTEVVKEVTKGLINGAIVQPANFLKENFGLYDPLAVQFVDPETGEFDFKLHIMSREEKADLDAKMAAGELPYAMSLDDLVAPDKDASGVAGAAGGISQFLGAYLGIGKLFRVGSGFTGAMTQGAAADFLAFDGSDKAVTDMLLDMGWIEPNMITELLKKDPNDPDYQGRFKAAIEGAGLGAVIEKAMIPVLGLAFRAIKDKDVPVDAARQAIQQGKLMMQGALLKAGQNAELRMAERGPAVDFLSSTMMSGVDPTIATDPLVAAAGRAVGDGFVAKVEPPTDDTPGIIAFHGSAADFDGFKLEKIGTGEGAQAYGYGLYFADKEDIAEWYRNTLSNMGVDPQPLKDAGMTVTEEMMAASYIRTSNSAEDAARDWANWHGKPFNDDLIDTFKAAQVSDGKMYKVGLEVRPDDLLDNDKALSEQPTIVQARLKPLLEMVYQQRRSTASNRVGKFPDTKEEWTSQISSGEDFYDLLSVSLADNIELRDKYGFTSDAVLEQTDTDMIASKMLFEAGIPGIKYLDNTSRDGAGTSNNYVIFDDSMIKILEKYGIVGPVAISAMALSEDES